VIAIDTRAVAGTTLQTSSIDENETVGSLHQTPFSERPISSQSQRTRLNIRTVDALSDQPASQKTASEIYSASSQLARLAHSVS